MERFRCEPFGIVTVRRRIGARSIRIRIEAGKILVSADYYTRDKDIVKLLKENEKEILEKQNTLESHKKFITEDFKLECRYFSLDVQRDEKLTRYLFTLKIDHNATPCKFTIRCNSGINFNNDDIQERLLKAINQTIRNVAKEPLETRTMQLANEFGFEVNSVKAKVARTKWGSCSSRKNINLSAYLILLPERLMDYVIIHELCHLKEMNHSARFHALVNKYTDGKESELEKELKGYSINIFDYSRQADV